MFLKTDILKSPQFLSAQLAIFVATLVFSVLNPPTWSLCLAFFIIVSPSIYLLTEQQKRIHRMEIELAEACAKEDEYIIRTEQLRRALHNVRSPISALSLRLQLLEKTSANADNLHLERMKESLQSAIDQVQTIGDIQKGKVKPTETIQLKLSEIRAYMAE